MGTKSNRLFPPFRLDPANAQLWRDDEEIRLRPKTFDVLRYLVDHPGQLVTKEALLDAIWPDVTVGDSLPATSVKELRRALDDDAKSPRFIETVHRRGYRFIASVTTTMEPEPRCEPNNEPDASKPIMVGREAELRQLRRWYSESLRGRRQVVFVAGEPGIGKTTFVNAFLDSVACEGAGRIGRGQCVEQYGASEPYMPVLEALSRLCREQTGERVTDLLRNFAPMWLAQMPGLLTPTERARLQIQIQGVTPERMLREITEALEAVAAESPLVLLLEDLHWSDFSTVALISAIARRSESARLILIGTYRPAEIHANDHPLRTMKQELELHHYCQELRPKLLSEKDIGDYLGRRLGTESRSLPRLAGLIHARTDGNPLFMVNMIDYLLANNGNGRLISPLERREEKWAEMLQSHRLDAVGSIREMVEGNLDRLEAEEREVLEVASVVGPEFSAASVAAALERPQRQIEACCAQLSRREQFLATQGSITWPDGTMANGFRFYHAVYQEVLYDRLPLSHRLQLHGRIAVRQEAGYGEQANEVATELAYHYSLANIKNKAIQYFQVAGDRAVGRGAMAEAEEQYRSALKLLAELPQTIDRDRQELALQMALGAVFWGSKSWSHPETGRAHARALELGEKLGETLQIVEAFWGLVTSLGESGRLKQSRKLSEQMLVVAERSGNRAALCTAHCCLGRTLLYQAQYLDAKKHLELARRYYEESDLGELILIGITAIANAAIVMLLLGFPKRASQLMKEVLHLADAHPSPSAAGRAHLFGSLFCRHIRDAQGGLAHAHVLRQLAANQPALTGLADFTTSWALMLQGAWEESAAYLRKSVSFYRANGQFLLLMRAKLYEADFLASQGKIDEALALVAEALTGSEEFALITSSALRRRADLLAQSSADVAAIDAAYRAAINCARSQGAKYHELQATTHYARWLKSHGRAAEARTMVAEIYNWFTDGFETTDLTEAKVLLDDLAT